MTIFDIGGHDGTLTLFFAKSVGPNGKIYAFEPNPFNYEYLLQNLQLNNSMNVEPFQLAIGASSYNAKFVFRNDGTFGTGTLDKEIQQQIINEQNYSIVEVKVESIDNLFNNKKLSKPDFVKIDVEGLEFDILQGMQMTLKEYKPNLFIEIHGANINDKMKNANEIISFLTGFNYSFYHIETQQIVSIKTTDLPIQGHLFCK
ncbi:FkbM family methyltransferase [uncultured Methanoregula sp.]|uniref:FkbM family methyltransferase n=1 Tax=uncultured Methanoregula sp. TaxID=1005933 RepID=UPI002AABC59C|nr:FkbM family methyltransferase [uncultured Methanoregula sp.]